MLMHDWNSEEEKGIVFSVTFNYRTSSSTESSIAYVTSSLSKAIEYIKDSKRRCSGRIVWWKISGRIMDDKEASNSYVSLYDTEGEPIVTPPTFTTNSLVSSHISICAVCRRKYRRMAASYVTTLSNTANDMSDQQLANIITPTGRKYNNGVELQIGRYVEYIYVDSNGEISAQSGQECTYKNKQTHW